MPSKFGVTLALLIPVVFTGCSSDQKLPLASSLFGARGYESLRHPVEVEAYRIKPIVGALRARQKDIGNYPIISGPAKVESKSQKDLQRILSSSLTYSWFSAKSCEFQPGVAVRFIGKESITDVLFCFSCNELKINVDGSRVGGEDFDKRRAELVAIVKRVFPNDGVVQKLEP